LHSPPSLLLGDEGGEGGKKHRKGGGVGGGEIKFPSSGHPPLLSTQERKKGKEKEGRSKRGGEKERVLKFRELAILIFLGQSGGGGYPKGKGGKNFRDTRPDVLFRPDKKEKGGKGGKKKVEEERKEKGAGPKGATGQKPDRSKEPIPAAKENKEEGRYGKKKKRGEKKEKGMPIRYRNWLAHICTRSNFAYR